MIYLQIRQLERDSDSDTKTETHSAMIGRDGGKKSHRDPRKKFGKTKMGLLYIGFMSKTCNLKNKQICKLTKKRSINFNQYKLLGAQKSINRKRRSFRLL